MAHYSSTPRRGERNKHHQERRSQVPRGPPSHRHDTLEWVVIFKCFLRTKSEQVQQKCRDWKLFSSLWYRPLTFQTHGIEISIIFKGVILKILCYVFCHVSGWSHKDEKFSAPTLLLSLSWEQMICVLRLWMSRIKSNNFWRFCLESRTKVRREK